MRKRNLYECQEKFFGLEENIRKMYELNGKGQLQIINTFMEDNKDFNEVGLKYQITNKREEISNEELVIFYIKLKEDKI